MQSAVSATPEYFHTNEKSICQRTIREYEGTSHGSRADMLVANLQAPTNLKLITADVETAVIDFTFKFKSRTDEAGEESRN